MQKISEDELHFEGPGKYRVFVKLLPMYRDEVNRITVDAKSHDDLIQKLKIISERHFQT